MALRLVTGRAGSGKTALCLAEIAAECRREPEGPPLLLITPEQATYETERALVERCEGFVRARVLSFTRLISVLALEFPGTGLPRLTPIQRTLLVTRAVQRRRNAAPNSPFFAVRGIEESLESFLAESRQCLLSPERLREAAATSRSPAFREKAAELAAFIEDFTELYAARFEDPQETFAGIAESIARSELLQGATIWVDGFYGYTPVEERALAALVERARRVTVTVPGDTARAREILAGIELAPHPVFHPVEETLARLAGLARSHPDHEESLTSLPRAGAAHRFSESEEHGNLEQGFLIRDAAALPSTIPRMRLIEAESLREEARIAAEICHAWITTDEIDPARIAVVTRSLDGYAAMLDESFRALRIPFFTDWNEPLDAHPLVVGIGAALRAALHRWQTEDVLDFARSGLAGVTRREAETLDAWCQKHPPQPRDWNSSADWAPPPSRSFSEEEPVRLEAVEKAARIDAVRRRVASRIAPIADLLGNSEEIAFGRLLDLVANLVDAWLSEVSAAEITDDEQAILNQFGEAIAQAGEALGTESMAAQDAVEQVQRLLASLALPRIPPMLGQVLLTQLDRSRFPPLDAVITLGWNADQFPARQRNRTLLNDDEREELRARAIDVTPPARRMFLRESFFAYLALTRTTGPIVVMRTRGGTGDAAPPSPYWEELRRLVPFQPVEHPSARCSISRAQRPREFAAAILRDGLGAHLQETPLEIPAAKSALSSFSQFPETQFIVKAATDQNLARMTPELLGDIFQNKWKSSISAMESYAKCPFQHFVRAMLRPEEPSEPEADPRDLGSFAHAVLEEIGRRVIALKIPWKTIEDQQYEDILTASLRGPVTRAERAGIFRTPSGRIVLEGMIRETTRFAHWMRRANEHVGLRTIAVEAAFGLTDAEFPPLEITTEIAGQEWRIALRGKIDRVDVLEAGGVEYICVVDYKLRGKSKFSLAEWEDGTAMQLPVYLLAIQNKYPDAFPAAALNAWIIPGKPELVALDHGEFGKIKMRGFAAGSFYEAFAGADPSWGRLPYIDGAQSAPQTVPRWGSAFSDEQFREILERTESMIASTGANIAGGIADPQPLANDFGVACDFCSYRPICRVDGVLNPPRIASSRSRQTVLADLGFAPPSDSDIEDAP